MSVLQNNINTYQTNTDYVNDMSKDFPNISYIQGTDEVKWNKYDPDHIVCVYNATSTSEATKLLYDKFNISYQIIDGVKQDTVQMNYTFDTLGEHTVKYKISSEYLNLSFNECTNLTSIIMPNNILQINSAYFCGNCSSLTNVKLSDNLNYIYDNSFNGCSSLLDITIPFSVDHIGIWSFKDCTSLTSVTVKATTPPALLYDALANTNNCPIYVPAESVDAYKAASGWSSYADRIQSIS